MVNSTWLITSELANQCARKVLFTCVVYTKFKYTSLRVIVFLGCFIVTDKTTACQDVTTWFNAQPQNWTLPDCNIECCTGDGCNDKPVPVLPVDPLDDSTDVTPTGPLMLSISLMALQMPQVLAPLMQVPRPQ